MANHIELTCHDLGNNHKFYSGCLPETLRFNARQFKELWNIHPKDFHEIIIHGRTVKTPRWQQAYGRDYHYTGQTNAALPVPQMLLPLQSFVQTEVEPQLDGSLVNWYDGRLGHYIGKHRDSRKNMVEGAPIVTISFGETRTFRLRPWRGQGYRDFTAADGSVFVMPYDVSLSFTHEVPQRASEQGRRISLTFRVFETQS